MQTPAPAALSMKSIFRPVFWCLTVKLIYMHTTRYLHCIFPHICKTFEDRPPKYKLSCILCVGKWGDFSFWDLWDRIAHILNRGDRRERKKLTCSNRIRCCGLRHCCQLHITHSWFISWARMYWSRSISPSVRKATFPYTCRRLYIMLLCHMEMKMDFVCVFFLV